MAAERRSAFAADEPSATPPSGDGQPSADAQPGTGGPTPPDTATTPPAAAPVAPKTYVVQTGDTMFSIAKKHGVSVDALLWANNLTDANVLKVGQQLTVPPSTGKLHTVKDGDTLDSLAQAYSVSKSGIAVVNGLTEDAALTPGQRLLIPVKTNDPAFAPPPLTAASNGDPTPIVPADAGTGSPTPPVVSTIAPLLTTPILDRPDGRPDGDGYESQDPQAGVAGPEQPAQERGQPGFRSGPHGYRHLHAAGHRDQSGAGRHGQDGPKQNPDGFSGYGWIVILDHGEGISTWYAHCGSFSVKEGEKVLAGDTIGAVGMTGRTDRPASPLRAAASTQPPSTRASRSRSRLCGSGRDRPVECVPAPAVVVVSSQAVARLVVGRAAGRGDDGGWSRRRPWTEVHVYHLPSLRDGGGRGRRNTQADHQTSQTN